MAKHETPTVVKDGSNIVVTCGLSLANVSVEAANEVIKQMKLRTQCRIGGNESGGKLFRLTIVPQATKKAITIQVAYGASKDVSVFEDDCRKDAEEVVLKQIIDILEVHDEPENDLLGKPDKDKDKDNKDANQGNQSQGGNQGSRSNRGQSGGKGNQQGGGK